VPPGNRTLRGNEKKNCCWVYPEDLEKERRGPVKTESSFLSLGDKRSLPGLVPKGSSFSSGFIPEKKENRWLPRGGTRKKKKKED